MDSQSLSWADGLPEEAKADLLERVQKRLARSRIFELYPDVGLLRRSLYPKHQAFLAAGRTERVRSFMAANRVGKTEGVGGYEAVLHLTGRYPEWWRGKRFDHPTKEWLAGDTSKSVREILQFKLLGPWGEFGTGLIPGDDLLKTTPRSGVPETIDTITVRHISGGASHGVFKSYDQKREAFQGSEQDYILLDEEPPLDIFSECVMRTMTNDGRVALTFTPLMGMTKLIQHMREVGIWEVGATWDDAPHLTKKQKDDLWRDTPAYMREARSKGIPARGSGVVFPVSEDSIKCEMFSPPQLWPCIGGLDFGWNHPMAGVKLAHNRDDDIVYVVGVHKRREASPLLFAEGVKPWGKWLPWAWPHDGLRRDKDTSGDEFAELFRKQGMNMLPGPASFSDDKLEFGVEAGIMDMLDRMQSGRFYVMEHLEEWFIEFRDYYRKDGVIVKERDDAMAATRYALMMLRYALRKPVGRRQGTAPVNWRTL